MLPVPLAGLPHQVVWWAGLRGALEVGVRVIQEGLALLGLLLPQLAGGRVQLFLCSLKQTASGSGDRRRSALTSPRRVFAHPCWLHGDVDQQRRQLQVFTVVVL